MIVGIGTDMIEIDRVMRACEKEAFLTRFFTGEEIQLIRRDPKKSADNFAVKESVVKLFGTGFCGIMPADVEVLRDEYGKPYVNLYGAAKDMADRLGISRIHVSITNTKKYASAFAVGESNRES